MNIPEIVKRFHTFFKHVTDMVLHFSIFKNKKTLTSTPKLAQDMLTIMMKHILVVLWLYLYRDSRYAQQISTGINKWKIMNGNQVLLSSS